MSNINLSQSLPESSIRSRAGLLNKSLGISLGILIVAFGIYFGLLFYQRTLDSNLASVNADIETEKKKIASDQANRVADFQDRLDVIGGALQGTAAPTDLLSRIESSMIPDTNLSNYQYSVDDGTIETTVVADSFKNIAEQIVAFKKSFSNVIVGDVKRRDDGKVEVAMTLAL